MEDLYFVCYSICMCMCACMYVCTGICVTTVPLLWKLSFYQIIPLKNKY